MIYCSFCNKSQKETTHMLHSGETAICTSCVVLCYNTLVKRHAIIPSKAYTHAIRIKQETVGGS